MLFWGSKLKFMARRNGEPVRHTCPDIDRIISTITSIVKEMDGCDNEDEKETLIEQIGNWKSELASIGVGKWCEMETLRSSNSALRDWGSEMYNEAESLETDRDNFESKFDELKDKISELENENEKLSDEISELQSVAQHSI